MADVRAEQMSSRLSLQALTRLLLQLESIHHQILNADHRHLMVSSERNDFGQARHAAVVIRQLTQHPIGFETGEAHEIYRGFGMPPTLQYTAFSGA